MQRITHLLRQQPVRFDRLVDIGGFYGNADIAEVQRLQQVHVAQHAFHHCLRAGTPVFLQERFFEGAAVDAHADRDAACFRRVHHGLDPVAVADVARIDAYLIRAALDGRQCQPVVEMNVRDQRNMDLLPDLRNSFRRGRIRHRHADNIAPRPLQRQYLRHSSAHIRCGRAGHGLHRYGAAAADEAVANAYFKRIRAFVHDSPVNVRPAGICRCPPR